MLSVRSCLNTDNITIKYQVDNCTDRGMASTAKKPVGKIYRKQCDFTTGQLMHVVDLVHTRRQKGEPFNRRNKCDSLARNYEVLGTAVIPYGLIALASFGRCSLARVNLFIQDLTTRVTNSTSTILTLSLVQNGGSSSSSTTDLPVLTPFEKYLYSQPKIDPTAKDQLRRLVELFDTTPVTVFEEMDTLMHQNPQVLNRAENYREKTTQYLHLYTQYQKDRQELGCFKAYDCLLEALNVDKHCVSEITYNSRAMRSLLNNINDGKPKENIIHNWNEKLKEGEYRRKMAAPKSQTEDRARKKLTELGITERDLTNQHFAREDDVPNNAYLWPTKVPQMASDSGVFHQKSWNWEQFKTDVLPCLPQSSSIEIYLSKRKYDLATYTAFERKDLRIFKWDNHVSRYQYVSGSNPLEWNLPANTWIKVTSIVSSPSSWQANKNDFSEKNSSLIAIEGAKDTKYKHLNIFEEDLRCELFDVARAISQLEKDHKLQDPDQGRFSGLRLYEGCEDPPFELRVTHSKTEGVFEYSFPRPKESERCNDVDLRALSIKG